MRLIICLTYTFVLMQDLYEFVFVIGGQDSPFTIIQNFPYRELDRGAVISDVDLGAACVLTVAEKADSPDPLSYVRINVRS